MATAADLMRPQIAIGVQDNASASLNAMASAADRAGASVEQMENRVRRGQATFAEAAGKLDAVENATARVERATAGVTRTMQAVEAAARAEGIAQERLTAVLVSGAAQKQAAALAAVRGFTAEQQAAALTRAGYAQLAAQVQASAAAQSNLGVRAATSYAAANDNAAQSSGRLRMALGQAGFQVQDFATQVSMGQNALMAFGVQGAQLAGVFGPTGAIAGAVLMVGVIGAQLLGMGESAATAQARIQTAFDGIKAESEGVRDLIKEIGDLFKTAAERAQDLARAQRVILANNADLRLSNAVQMQDAAGTRIPTLEREIAVLERRAAVEQELASRARRGGGLVPVDQTTDVTSALFAARAQLDGLRAEMALQSRRIGEINTAREQLGRAGNDQGFGEYGPPAPERERRAAGSRSMAAADEELAAASRAVTDAQKDYDTLMREGVTITQSVRTEQEKYAEQLSVLNTLLASGAITQETYNRAVAAADPAVKAARDAARQVEQDNKTTTDSIVRYGADRFADMFGDNKKSWAEMWSSFLSTARATMARIAAEAIIRPVITPIVSSLGLGALGSSNGVGIGSLLGLGGTQGGAGGVSTAGSTSAGLQQAQQSAGLVTAGRFGNLGNAFTGNGLANTGFGGLDGLLNTQLTSPVLTSTGYVGAGGVPIVSGASSLSAAGAIGGAAGLAGGAYGIYSGVQRGGVGGYTTAAGGALSAGLSAAILAGMSVPVYGWIAAAVLAVAGALLPGQKASGKGQSAFVDGDTGLVTGYAGLGGDRFSQENRDASEGAAKNISALARQLGDALGGAKLGASIAVGTTSSRGDGAGQLYLDIGGRKAEFANDEGGSKALAEEAGRLILRQFREANRASGDYKGILDASGDNLETLQKNLEWYDGTYKALTKSADATNEYTAALEAARKPWDDAISKANELSLATEKLSEARDKEIARIDRERDLRLREIDATLGLRDGSLSGTAFVALQREQAAISATNELDQFRASLQALGLTADEVSGRVDRLAAIQADEAAGLDQARVLKLSDYTGTLSANAMGDTKGAARIALSASFRDEYAQTQSDLRGLGATAEQTAAAMADLHKTQQLRADEFENGVKDLADAASGAAASLNAVNDNAAIYTQGIIDLAARMRAEVDSAYLGANSPLTGQQRFGLAQEKFNSGKLGLNEYLSEAKGVFGSATSEYAGLFYGALDQRIAAAQDQETGLLFQAMASYNQQNPGSTPVGLDPYWDTWKRETAPRPQGAVQGVDTAALATLMQGMLAELRSGNSVRVMSGEAQIDLTSRMVQLLAALEGKAQLAAAA